jgi:ankyrin repeat protein
LMRASMIGTVNDVRFLLRHKASRSIRDNNHATALDLARIYRNTDVINFFMSLSTVASKIPMEKMLSAQEEVDSGEVYW